MSQSFDQKVDLNQVGENELIKVLQINPRLAKRIIALRPYTSFDQLTQIWGIDSQTIDKLKNLFFISPDFISTDILPSQSLEMPKYLQENGSSALNQEATQSDPGGVNIERRNEEGVSSRHEVQQEKIRKPIDWKPIILLTVILMVGAIFRFSGLNWDDGFHQHPDERYMTMVAEAIRPVDGIGSYFDTATSTLNPLKHGSYTYGMLPLFVTRMVAGWVNKTSYDSITLVGRFLSGVFDLAAIWALYLLAKHLYNQKIAYLAAALAAAAVLPIQLSHFFTVDSFSTVFVVLSFYFAILAIPIDQPGYRLSKNNQKYFAYFGFLVGLAGACKVNTLPVMAIIFIAAVVYLIMERKQPQIRKVIGWLILGLFIAVFMALLAFRIFQPYAFNGPAITNLSINERWLQVIKEVTNQVAGNSEWPPNHHWTNRPFPYAWINMVLWGMGLPLGLMAWFGWGWAGFRMWKGEWRKHLLPFTWVLAYFIWQNMQFWRYMRYFMPIYPFLILFAAWAMVEILSKNKASLEHIRDIGTSLKNQWGNARKNWKGILAILLVAIVTLGSYGYALAFIHIYSVPHTRVSASRWILNNIDGPFNVKVETSKNEKTYPIPVYNNHVLEKDEPGIMDLKLTSSGDISSITAPQIKRLGGSLFFKITRDQQGEDRVTDGRLVITDDDIKNQQMVNFGDVTLDVGSTYYFYYRMDASNVISLGDLSLGNENQDEGIIPIPLNLDNQSPGIIEGTFEFTSDSPLRINRLQINNFSQQFAPSIVTLQVSILKDRDEGSPLAQSITILEFGQPGLAQKAEFSFPAISVDKKNSYQIKYELLEGSSVQLLAENFTLETSWDDALPLSVDKIDALGGIYTPLNLELYEPDTIEKRERIISILDKSEFIVIPSNRAYDAMPRLELRYPLTLRYYQLLFGCDCSSDALEKHAYQLQVPYKSVLGFDLVGVFESDPTLGPIHFNDQTADESFTVYDHPKVMVFKKSAEFSIQNVRNALEQVNLEDVIFQVPLNYTRAPTALMLPADRLEAQTNGGTWSKMFDRLSLLNQNPILTTIVWYLLILLIGWSVLPIMLKLFKSLPDRGYPFMRMAGLLILAWLPWIAGSAKIFSFSRLIIIVFFGLILVLNSLIFIRNKHEILAYFQSSWRHIVLVEFIFALVFIFSLSIRLANPDLWHPWLGGEKPMDFTFFNAIIKSVYFPPENPWFSGHYLNYYYYGYVIAAIPTKILGIIPSIAFNLILPTWFAMTGIGVFGVGYNLYEGFRRKADIQISENPATPGSRKIKMIDRFISSNGSSYFIGIFALVAVLFFGNFYEVKLLWQYLPEAANLIQDVNPASKLDSVLSGASRVISGETSLPGDPGRWYFAASRPILHDGPDTPIAEFPYFSFLYADLHPHLLTMPFYALAFAWCLSLLLEPINKRKWWEQALMIIMAGLFFGLFRASHTWDFPTFLLLGVLTLVWTIWRLQDYSLDRKFKTSLFYLVVFSVVVMLFYSPFTHWFKTEYASVELWEGARTPLSDYFVVYGLSIFMMLGLLVKETWVEIRYIYRRWFIHKTWATLIPSTAIAALLFSMYLLWKSDYQVLAFGMPIMVAWVYLIFFKKKLSEIDRLLWILFAIGFGLTFVVEVLVLKGDVGRSNMVFRMYIEAWFVLGLAVSVAILIMLRWLRNWAAPLRILWIAALQILILLSLIYPLIATSKKTNDRWPGIIDQPKTLDGSLFMLGDSVYGSPQGAIYSDEGREIDLSLDYYGIQYMQEHIQGSPVIVEGHTVEYRWGSRYAIYTGLPSVIGWSWHTRQHNSLIEGSVIDKRINDVDEFYNTTDIQYAKDFLKRYDVKYIVVSGLERVYYSAEGLEKFNQMVNQGDLEIVFGNGESNSATIYHLK